MSILAHPMVLERHDPPRFLHRTDCPHPDLGHVFREATAAEISNLPDCADCARREMR